jgi:hypothetical protein
MAYLLFVSFMQIIHNISLVSITRDIVMVYLQIKPQNAKESLSIWAQTRGIVPLNTKATVTYTVSSHVGLSAVA